MAKETKQTLLDCAIDLISRQSYGAVSVDDICNAAGVRKGGFYHYFESKVDLLVEALEKLWNDSRADMHRAFAPSFAPAEQLANFCALAYAKQKERFEKSGKVVGCPFMTCGSELCTQEEKVRVKVEELFDRYAGYFEELLRDAQGLGITRVTNPAVGAREMFSYVTGVLSQARIKNDVDIIRRNLLPGLMRYLQAEVRQEKREALFEDAI